MIDDDQKKVHIKILSEESKPLVFIDDVEMDASFELNSIDPDSIERIEILKGQKAFQKAGEKGKNGVIIIWLKN